MGRGLDLGHSKAFIFIFVKLYKNKNKKKSERIFAKNFARNYEKMNNT